MGALQPRYSKKESARRGQEIYEESVRPLVEEGNNGKVEHLPPPLRQDKRELNPETLTTPTITRFIPSVTFPCRG